jgi:hypothetical protein
MSGPGFNIEQFKAYVGKNDVLSNNRFLARFYLPIGLQGIDNDAAKTSRQLEYWGENIIFPGISLNVHLHNRYGYGMFEKKPDKAIVQDMRAVFLGDGQGAIWSFFNQWVKLVANHDLRSGIDGQTGVRGVKPYILSYKNEYAVNIEIQVFDKYGDVQLHLMLRDAYPISIGDLPLDWNDNNTVMRIPVFFTFMDYYNERKL